MINMTKHWTEHSVLAPPALSHLGEHRDHQLDFHRNAHSFQPSGLTRSSPVQHWPRDPPQMVPQQPPRLERPAARPELHSATAFMDKTAPPGSSGPNAEDGHLNMETVNRDSWNDEREKSSSGKKKNYQRYPKPPYSYLAMIAMVIQRSPEKKLTLSEVIIKRNRSCSLGERGERYLMMMLTLFIPHFIAFIDVYLFIYCQYIDRIIYTAYSVTLTSHPYVTLEWLPFLVCFDNI